MPPKQPNQTRAWGTRYDTLPMSPPVSPETQKAKNRMVAQDDDCEPSPDGRSKRKDDRLPHDASIFVGSLPSNVDQAELTRLLTGHLSEHAEIRSIKVIRDSKGGVCAFVQCEDSTSASAFLQSLQSSPPKPFLGRYLRYEPARAFRTLLISYRTPSQAAASNEVTGLPSGEIVKLELPQAIRMWKPKNSKYHRIVYNAEAIEAERYARSLDKTSAVYEEGLALYFNPLNFDEESIVKLATFFGPLEQVSKFAGGPESMNSNPNYELTASRYPPPHNAGRSSGMDAGCWEIKWDHRDNCVTALMTLRRIPHLSVSWAHQPQQSSMLEQRPSPGSQHTANPIPRTQGRVDRFQPYTSPPPFVSLAPASGIRGGVPHDPSFQNKSIFEDVNNPAIKHGSAFSISDDKNWDSPITPPPGPGHQTPTGGPRDTTFGNLITTKVDWAETDFPSLSAGQGFGQKLDWSAWDEAEQHENDFRSPSIIASQSANDILCSRRTQIPSPLTQGDELSTPGSDLSPVTPRTNLSQIPVTPTSQTYDVRLPECDTKGLDHNGGDSSHRSVREFDPTTLFVGGLEMYGPGAWTEEKVRAFFARFGGLEHVRVVRPVNSNTAFAFVKYDNTSSPAQAILEEHNRIYAGRALKVQLRDINPTRSPWKNNRGRTRFPHHHPGRKVVFSPRAGDDLPGQVNVPVGQSSSIENNKAVGADMGSGSEVDDKQQQIPGVSEKQHVEEMAIRSSENKQTEKYREWYDAPVSTGTPSDPGVGSSSSTTAPVAATPLPCSAPGYYPMPWMHPYAQPGHFQMPYYGPYPAYPIPTVPVRTPPASDASGPAAANQPPWPGIVYTPFAPYFGPPARPAADLHGQPTPAQAPLVPSGFIQNEQGTLIPVYPPDALDQYMANQGTNPNSNTDGIASNPAQPGSAPPWASAQVLPGSTSNYSIGSQTNGNPPRMYHVPFNPLWNPMLPPIPHLPPSINMTQSAPAAPRIVENGEVADSTSSPPTHPRKQLNRLRDSNNHNLNRSRTFNVRNGRSQIYNQGLTGNTGGTNSHYRNTQIIEASDWNEWGTRQ